MVYVASSEETSLLAILLGLIPKKEDFFAGNVVINIGPLVTTNKDAFMIVFLEDLRVRPKMENCQ